MRLMPTPETRLKLYRKWEYLLSERKYCIADFWNSGILTRGCIAYGRSGGYIYIDWNGNIMPCVFVPYYVDNVYDLYEKGKTLADALFSNFMKNGRQWQEEYGLGDYLNPDNWLMPCSIRDHYANFRSSILTRDALPENEEAGESMRSNGYCDAFEQYEMKLKGLTDNIWNDEYLSE